MCMQKGLLININVRPICQNYQVPKYLCTAITGTRAYLNSGDISSVEQGTNINRDFGGQSRYTTKGNVKAFCMEMHTLSPFKHCRVTLRILPKRQFRLNETSNHFMQGEGGGRGGGRPPAVCMNQHTA